MAKGAAAAIYCRISSDPEGREVGVDRQEEDCRALADRLGLDVVDVVIDNDVSASTISTKPRPNYDAMLARARRGEVAVLLAYSNSRLTRRPRELEDLLELHRAAGTRISTVVSGEDDLSTADGRMVARYKAVADAAEAERTAERVRRAKAQAAAQGRWRGGPRPFGYEADGVTLRPAEAEALRSAAEAIIQGASLGSQVRFLNDAEIPTATGGRWTVGNLRQVLQRPRNAGLLGKRDGTIVGKAEWPAIVPEDQWRAIVAMLRDPARSENNPGPKPRHLLSGIAICGVCSELCVTGKFRGGRYYHCRADRAHVSRLAEPLEELVAAVVRGRLAQPDLRDLLSDGPDDAALHVARDKLAEVAARESDLTRLFAAGTITADALASGSSVLRAQREAAEAVIAREAARSTESWIAAAPDPVAAYDAADLDRQRAIIRSLLSVTVNKAPRGRRKGYRPGDPPTIDPAYIDLTWRA